MSAALALVEIAADPFGLVRAMNRMSAARFALSVRDNRLVISPFSRLSEQQRGYLHANKAALVALLSDADDLHRALVQAGTDGLDWREGAPADWSDDRLLAAGEVLYSTGRMVSRHDRRYAAECAPPPAKDILPDTASASPAETTIAADTWTDNEPDMPSDTPPPASPDDPLAARIATLMAQGWSQWNAEARARSESIRQTKPGARP
ncbi:MAG: hypothetical protein IPK63_16010 [Candidatus Competibacteraceae bacterium]|nr:hypothetical protein [Candidatus Competibacteraceae bacterium]